MISILLALTASFCNAMASVLQRRGTLAVPDGAGPVVFVRTLLSRPIWFAGIAAMIGGFLFQAGALAFGGLALVEPLLAMELPFTMLLIALTSTRRLSGQSWLATVSITAGLAVLLFAASPGRGTSTPEAYRWVLATLVIVGCVGGLLSGAWAVRGPYRTALLGIATSLGFAFTAALMKGSTGVLRADPIRTLTSWQLYAMVAAGLLSVAMLQVTLRSGTLVAAQPALTISDPVASMILGALLFDEPIRAGAWIIPEVLGVALIVYGVVEISRTPAFQGKVAPLQT